MNELENLKLFILSHTKFSFKDVESTHVDYNQLSIYAYFNYEETKVSVEGWSVFKYEEIGHSIDSITSLMINDEIKKAYKIYQRNKKIETILLKNTI